MGALLGVGSVLVAGLFWGSNFVVTKRYDMGDGMHFQLLFCLGILVVGVFTLAFAEPVAHGEHYPAFPVPDFRALVSMEGLVGGAIWTAGNLLTVPILQRIGIGLGLSIWSGTGTVVSFAFSRIAVFGLEPETLHPPAAGFAGCLLGVLSLAIFSTVDASAGGEGGAGSGVEDGDGDGDGDAGGEGGAEEDDLSVRLLEVGAGVGAEGEVEDGAAAAERSESAGGAGKSARSQRARVEGIAMALFAGLMYGFQFVPLAIHKAQYPSQSENAFFFSHFLGIFVCSLAAFVAYALWNGNRPRLVPAEAVLPSLTSGAMWAVACMGSMTAVTELGLGIGFPLTSNGAFLVNASWSIFVFKEVKGRRNLAIFAAAGTLNLLSCVFLAVARS